MSIKESESLLGERVSEAKERAEDMGRTAAKKLDEARNETAGALHAAASSVRATARQGSEAIDNLAERAAAKLDSASSYVRDLNGRGILADLQQGIRRNPGRSLVVAAVVGFVVGTAVRRR